MSTLKVHMGGVPGYVIAPTGNDTTGDGTYGNPWATLGKFYSVAVAGDTLRCRGGTYADTTLATASSVGTSGAPITVAAYPGETPVFDGGAASGSRGMVFNNGAAYHIVDGLTFQNFIPTSNGVIVIGFSSEQDTTHHITIRNCTFSARADWTSFEHAIYPSAYNTDVTIEDCVFLGVWTEGNSSAGINLGSHDPAPGNFLVQRCVFDAWSKGVYISGIDAYGSILHNTFTGCEVNVHCYYGHGALLIRDNVSAPATADIYCQEPYLSDITQDHNYWDETLTASPDYGLTAGSSAIDGALDGSDAGWVDYVP